jgi:hypothetical protein
MEDMRAFRLKAYVVGSPDDYNIRISSDLDKVLQKALSKQFAKLAARWEKSLNSAVLEKTGGQFESLNEKIDGLSILKSELEGRNRQIASLLKELSTTRLPGIKLPF